jgi:TPR repeat protein
MNTKLLIKKANKGDLCAQEKLAWLYDNGIGVRKSYKNAFYWYEKSAKNGRNPIIYYNLGLCYLSGQGTTKDYQKAFYWTLKAANSGDVDAILAIGWHYLNGCGVEKDLGLATKWYHLALKKKESGAANFSLGQIAYDSKQFKTAIKYFTKAESKFNHSKSCYYLGRMYFEGKGVKKDTAKSKELLIKAVSLGENKAKRLLHSKKFKKLFIFSQNVLN